MCIRCSFVLSRRLFRFWGTVRVPGCDFFLAPLFVSLCIFHKCVVITKPMESREVGKGFFKKIFSILKIEFYRQTTPKMSAGDFDQRWSEDKKEENADLALELESKM